MPSDRTNERDELIVLTPSRETNWELFRFEYVARRVGAPPKNHVHDQQEERIEVVSGSVRYRIRDEERVLRAGERVTIPKGVPHAVWNDGSEGSRTIGEFRPALNMQEVFEAALET